MVLTISLIFGVALAYFGPLLLRRALDRSGSLDVPPVPETPDPYRIAYLRGGENEVIRLMLFDLVRRGHLEVIETKRLALAERRLRRSETAPEDDELTDIERRMVGCFIEARKPVEVYRGEIPALVRRDFGAEKTELARDHMLIPEAVDRRLSGADYAIAGAGCVMGFALGVNALGHAAWGIGLVVLFLLARKLIKRHMRRTGHMSALGRKYLASLQAAFANAKTPVSGAKTASADRFRDDPLLSVGLYGSAVLMGSDYHAFAHMIPADLTGGIGMETGFAVDGGGGFGGGDGGGGCGGGCGGGG